MKYLKVTPAGLYVFDTLTKQDLVDIKTKFNDYLIDLTNQTFFDAEKNEWVKIPEL